MKSENKILETELRIKTEEVPFTPDAKAEHTGKKLTPVKETFNLADGDYSGKITNAFDYSEDKIMIKIALPDSKTFIAVTNEKHINQYPYSQLVMQAGVEYLNQLVGLDVVFTIKNNVSGTGTPYSNIKRISLQKQ